MPVLESLAIPALGFAVSGPPANVPDAQASVAIYCEASCSAEAVLGLQDQLDDWFAFKGPIAELGPATSPRASLAPIPIAEFGAPEAETLEAYGVGLAEADTSGLAASQEVVIVEIAAPVAQALEAQARLNEAALAFASSQGGWLEDLDTREVFSQDAWQSERVEAAREAALWRLVRIESYDVEGWDRMVTLGMRKLGLQELSVTQTLPDFSGDLSAALILMAAQGVEGKLYTESYTLDLSSVKGAATRAWLDEHLWTPETPGVATAGTGGAVVRLRATAPQDGDNQAPLLEVQFATPGDTPAEQVGAFLDGLWGYGALPIAAPGQPLAALEAPPADPTQDAGAASEPAPTQADPGPAPQSLDEARAQAAAALTGSVKPRYAAGLPEGAELYIKGPFPSPSGEIEWMWVEVRSWDGADVRGILMNEPSAVPGLQKGSVVGVPEGEVFDYLLRLPDGTQEGGGTEAFL